MVTSKKKYNIIDPKTGILDRRIFVDQAIYDEEMEKIFGRTWQIVAHVSLIPNRNDYFLSYIGEDPVIVTRDEQDKIHVMLNMCRHRGNRVLRADDGNNVSNRRAAPASPPAAGSASPGGTPSQRIPSTTEGFGFEASGVIVGPPALAIARETSSEQKSFEWSR